MLNLLIRFFRNPAVRLALKILASIASALLVVTGYWFFRTRRLEDQASEGREPDDETITIVEMEEDPTKKGKVHQLFPRREKRP